MKNLDKSAIISLLTENMQLIKEKYGVITIGLIGSYARNEQKEDSDIDFIVEFSEAKYNFLAGLWIFLEQLFGKEIDIIRKSKYNSEKLLKRVKKDAIYA